MRAVGGERGGRRDGGAWVGGDVGRWGERLLAQDGEDGKIYGWAINTGTPAALLSNAPTGNEAILVTEERFVFALGAGGNPRKVQWSDREDNNTWTPATTNEAGDLELATTGTIMAGVNLPGGSFNLTSREAQFATYQGPPQGFGN